MRFEVERTFARSGRGFVVVRILDDRGFRMCGAHTLGGAPIESWFDQPRILDSDGQPRTDVFTFALMELGDLDRFQAGDVVEMGPEACG